MKSINSLSIRTILYVISQTFSRGINAIAAFIFVRLLSTEEYGIVSVYTALVAIMTVVISLGMDGTIQIAKTKYGTDKLDAYCSTSLTVSGIFFSFIILIVLAIGLICGDVFHRPLWYVLLLLFHSFGDSCLRFRSAYYTTTKQADKDLLVSILTSVLSLGISITAVVLMDSHKYIGRMAGFACAYFCLGTCFMYIMLRKGKCYFNRQYFRFCLPLAIPLIFNGLSAVIITQFDKLMLDYLAGSYEVGLYSFGLNLAYPISTLWYALNHSWIPEYHELMADGKTKELNEHSNNYMFVFTGLVCGYITVSKEALRILGTPEYYTLEKVLPLMILYFYIQFMYTFPINYEFFKGNTKLIGTAMVISAFLNMGLNYVLIPKLGIMGAIAATIASSCFLLVIHDFNARFILKNYHYSLVFYLKGFSAVLGTLALTYLFIDYLPIRWAIGAVIAIFLVKHIIKKKAII